MKRIRPQLQAPYMMNLPPSLVRATPEKPKRLNAKGRILLLAKTLDDNGKPKASIRVNVSRGWLNRLGLKSGDGQALFVGEHRILFPGEEIEITR